ncbi:MAG: VWA domain-containing protein [Myxococcota bacterium]
MGMRWWGAWGRTGLALAVALLAGCDSGGGEGEAADADTAQHGDAPGADGTSGSDAPEPDTSLEDVTDGTCAAASAECEGEVSTVCVPGEPPEVADCAALGLVCRAGTCQTPLEAVECVQFRRLRPVQTNTPLPGSVVMAFAVDSCAEEGELPVPIVGLRLDDERADFEILEDGEPVSVFESAARVFNDRRAEVYLTIVMDNSPSVADSGALEEAVGAAKGLVDEVMGGDAGDIRVRVAFFSKSFVVEQDFTADPSLAKAALDRLLTDDTGSNTTNLYGALIDAVGQSEATQVQRVDDMKDGVFTLGQIVLFTDGSDQAALKTLAEAESAVQGTRDDVFLLALGGELNTDVLSGLGKSGWGLAATAGELADEFTALAQRIKLLQKRVYVLGYCSPKLAGSHSLTVRVTGKDGQSAPVSFDASTFDQAGETCSAEAFEVACDGRDCGGLLCGGCAGEGLCTEELQCVCPDDHLALPDCTECAEKFTGEDCTECADPRFTGPECDQCAPPFFGEGCQECEPQCDGLACGDDGCGGTCGSCGAGEACFDGACECAPQCDGKDCGADGCGGTCGTCPDEAPFCLDDQCEASCDTDCDGKDCGPDGCGGTCGTCPGAAPWCVAGNCALTECPDGCEGQQCACDDDFTCVDGACSPCGPGCEGEQCGCGDDEVCHDGLCCAPICDPHSKQCGPDLCGGTCGSCEDDRPCELDGSCCVPSCGDKECGDDGCGGSCGSCPGVVPFCDSGKCAAECGEGLTECDGACVDLASEPKHCGACGHTCGITCDEGRCLELTHVKPVVGGSASMGFTSPTDDGGLVVAGRYTGAFMLRETPLASEGDGLFVARLDGAGETVWSKTFAGESVGQLGVRAGGVDADGNIFLAGDLEGSLDLGGTTIQSTAEGDRDIFVVKLDSTGDHLWSHMYGTAADQVVQAGAVASDGSFVFAGRFENTLNLGGDVLNAWSSDHYYELFVARLDAAGGHVWSKAGSSKVPGHGYIKTTVTSLAVDGAGKVAVSADVESCNSDCRFEFDGIGIATHDQESFVLALDDAGDYLWRRTVKYRNYDGLGFDGSDALVAMMTYYQSEQRVQRFEEPNVPSWTTELMVPSLTGPAVLPGGSSWVAGGFDKWSTLDGEPLPLLVPEEEDAVLVKLDSEGGIAVATALVGGGVKDMLDHVVVHADGSPTLILRSKGTLVTPAGVFELGPEWRSHLLRFAYEDAP